MEGTRTVIGDTIWIAQRPDSFRAPQRPVFRIPTVPIRRLLLGKFGVMHVLLAAVTFVGSQTSDVCASFVMSLINCTFSF